MSKKQYSKTEKIMHYTTRMKNPKLSLGQRRFAAARLNALGEKNIVINYKRKLQSDAVFYRKKGLTKKFEEISAFLFTTLKY